LREKGKEREGNEKKRRENKRVILFLVVYVLMKCEIKVS